MNTKTVKAKELTEETFTISYDAPEDILENHEIDAKALGQAILGMNLLIEETARIISNGSAEVKLKVTAPAKEGSLAVVFALLADPVTAAKVLATLGIAVHAGVFAKSTVFQVLREIKNRKITSITIEGDDDDATITTSDGEIIVADRNVARLVSDSKIREAIHQVVQAPLSGKEGGVFKVLDENESQVEEIKEEELLDFSQLPKGSLEEIDIRTEVITIRFEQVNFASHKGWRVVLPDGSEHSATVRDEAFLERVRRSEQAFQKQDRYEVRLRTKTTFRPTRSTIERDIIDVLRNWDAPGRNQ